ncbi:uncharacterized protein LOC129894840 [Solanum dulcamara]|uniref:uncharacterized protein LOC129894840 n=1 Tax=Solanum dulcamara TaxID=45834 RepID=UPI002485F787|nr:uncharacterized protein LOC129894840 [Solanum dulcamara]
MKEGESVDEYFTRTLTVVNKMRIYGGKLDDDDVIKNILRSMSSKFAYVVCSIEKSKDIDTMSIDELQSSLLIHEQRMTPPRAEEQALKVATQFDSFNGNGFSRGRGRGHGQDKGSGEKSNFTEQKEEEEE